MNVLPQHWHQAKNVTFFIKVSFNIGDHTIMIREMSFKFLIFLTVYPRDDF